MSTFLWVLRREAWHRVPGSMPSIGRSSAAGCGSCATGGAAACGGSQTPQPPDQHTPPDVVVAALPPPPFASILVSLTGLAGRPHRCHGRASATFPWHLAVSLLAEAPPMGAIGRREKMRKGDPARGRFGGRGRRGDDDGDGGGVAGGGRSPITAALPSKGLLAADRSKPCQTNRLDRDASPKRPQPFLRKSDLSRAFRETS